MVSNTAYVLFEPDEEQLARIAAQAGFRVEIRQKERASLIALVPLGRRPMFFDATDARQAPKLAVARTFASAATGMVFNTPFVLESLTGPGVQVRLVKQVRWDQARKFPHGPSESSLLALFQQLVQDLATGMVGLCGASAVAKPRSTNLIP